MIPTRRGLFLLSLVASLTAAAGRQGVDDPQLRAAVELFFATQEAEDVAGYLSLWSTTAQRPPADQLKFVFDSGDDKFSEIAIVSVFKVVPAGDRVRVRVSATRDRMSPPRRPGGPPLTFHTTMAWSLTYVREGAEWKLVREGPAVDGLAESLIEAETAEQRERLLAAEPELVNDTLIVALSRRATQAGQLQAHALAQKGFERMLELARRLGNQMLEGEALQNLANAMYFQRNLEGALKVYEERLALERGRGDNDGIASSLLGVATIRYTFAEYGLALTSYREALEIQERQGDQGGIATTLISTGNILYLQGDFTNATADYARSRDINRKILNTAGEADALEGMGRVFVAQGDYAAALDAFAGALAEGKARNDRNGQGSALLNIGDVHFRLGNLDSARAALEESRTHFEAVKDLSYVGRAWQSLAMIDLVSGSFAAAEEKYKRSSASCAGPGDADCVATATVGLAFAQTAQDKFPEGITSYKKAIEAFSALKRREQAARAQIGLSRALAGSGVYAGAVEAAVRARREAEALANDDVLWRALTAEAASRDRLKEVGSDTRAMTAALASVAAVDRLLEAARVRPSAPVARDSGSAFVTLAILQAQAGDAAGAFESIERMRVHDLRVMLAAGERDICRGMSDAERDEERAIAVDLVSLHAQLSREKGLPKPDSARIGRLEKSLADATARRAAQQQRLFERLPDLRTWRGLVPPATRADVADLLVDARTLLVEFAIGDESVLVVTARRVEKRVEFAAALATMDRKTLATQVAALIQPETLRDPQAWRRASHQFVEKLPLTWGDASLAIVIPHEILWRVPFEALPSAVGQVVDSTSVSYAPSVTALVRTPPHESGSAGAYRLVAVAAPALAPAVAERIAQTAPGWTIRTPASAEREAGLVARDADPATTIVLSGSAATESAVRERLPSADVVHLAAPFRINGASPLFSPVLLAPEAAYDGALEAREIMNLDLHARATLLTDGAAMTMRDAADEAPALAWAWRAAGVPVTIMPRWAGDESASDELVAEWHRRLRGGETAATALQGARTKIRSTEQTSAPFYWAGWLIMAGR
jgi:tetratricopeptide (TPR) repeat protein/CHAT domain-containing protein